MNTETRKRVVVTGLGLVSPAGNDVATSWERIKDGQSAVQKIKSFEDENLPVQIAAPVVDFSSSHIFSPKEVRLTSRFVQLAAVAGHQALSDANLIESSAYNREDIGCSIGVGIGDINSTFETSVKLHSKGVKAVSPFFIPYTIPNMAAGVTAKLFDLKGPNLCMATACASGTHSIGEAFHMVRSGRVKAMLCGGAEAAICKLTVVAFGNMKALSKRNDDPGTASRPFSKSRDGFVLGEGAGVVVIETLEGAIARGAPIYCELVGYGTSGDAYHISAPAPEGVGFVRCMENSLKDGNVDASEIDYINAHGTSTPINDLYETQAINSLFQGHAKKLKVSSIKGIVGHGLGAAGGIEGVITAKAIADQIAPPTVNLTEPDENLDLDYLANGKQAMSISHAISNSFGFGGTNATLVFKRYSGV